MSIFARIRKLFGRPGPLSDWFAVTWDDDRVLLDVRPPQRKSWTAQFNWGDIERVCFEATDYLQSDTIYIWVKGRAESYVIPTEARNGSEFWMQILDRGLFDLELSIVAAGSNEGLFCWPPPTSDEVNAL